MRMRFCLLALLCLSFTISCAPLNLKPAHLNLGYLYQDNTGNLDTKTVIRNSVVSTVYVRVTNHKDRVSYGTGVIIDSQAGFIITAAHVIRRAKKIKVTTLRLNDENEVQSVRSIKAEVLAVDRATDSAILMVSRKHKLPPAMPIYRDQGVYFGQPVVHFGKTSEISLGRVIRIQNYNKQRGRTGNCLRIKIDSDFGDSGAPVVDLKTGRLLGIVTSILINGKKNITFATPIHRILSAFQGAVVGN